MRTKGNVLSSMIKCKLLRIVEDFSNDFPILNESVRNIRQQIIINLNTGTQLEV